VGNTKRSYPFREDGCEEGEGENSGRDAAEVPQELEQGAQQRDVSLVRVCVPERTMIDDKGPGEVSRLFNNIETLMYRY